jgi:hypothetical protein
VLLQVGVGALSCLVCLGLGVSSAPALAAGGEAPPEVNPVAPGWNDAESGAAPGDATPEPPSDEPEKPKGPTIQGAAGLHWLFASGKAMPGITLRAGHRLFWFDFETSLVFLTERSEAFDTSLLGSQLGFYFAFRPLYGKRGELTTGVGSDVYGLWNLHGDSWEVSLSLRLAGHAWLTEKFGVFATARAYPLATSGLELGTKRDGTRGWPVMFGTGVELRFQ